MKNIKLLLLMSVLAFFALSTLFMHANAITTRTAISASQFDNVHVDHVDHSIKILQAGSMIMNDTVQLSSNQTTTLGNYSLGFPYTFKSLLANVYAFNASNPQQALNITLNTGLRDGDGTYRLGFYGVTVIFPSPGIQLSSGKSSSFTVVFVFANTMLSSTTLSFNEQTNKNETVPVFTMGFPVFPSLAMSQNTTAVNITVASPPKLTASASSVPQLLVNPRGTSDTGQTLVYTADSGAFAYTPGWLNYTQISGSTYQLASFDNLNRKLEIDGFGNVVVTDVYTITSLMQQAESGVELALPTGATSLSAFDAQGSPITASFVQSNSTDVGISFGFAIQRGQSAQFKLVYYLTSGNYLQKVGTNDFVLNLPVAKGFDRVAQKLTLTVSLPEGASIKEYPNVPYELQSNALQQTISLSASNVSSSDKINLHLAYVYSVFWSSFRPTLWMTAFITIALAIAFFWTAMPKPSAQKAAVMGVSVKPQTLKTLVSSYEERTKIILELDSLERQAQKGRIPRRRYKIRKRMLESQMTRLDRDLVDLKQRAKSMGPRYAEILKTLEISEAELEGIEAEERRTAAKYRAGALTLDAYRNLQEQYKRRRDKARTTIDGALLRLSEGMS